MKTLKESLLNGSISLDPGEVIKKALGKGITDNAELSLRPDGTLQVSMTFGYILHIFLPVQTIKVLRKYKVQAIYCADPILVHTVFQNDLTRFELTNPDSKIFITGGRPNNVLDGWYIQAPGVYLDRVRNCTIRNCTFRITGEDGLIVEHVLGWTWENNVLEECKNIYLQSTKSTSVQPRIIEAGGDPVTVRNGLNWTHTKPVESKDIPNFRPLIGTDRPDFGNLEMISWFLQDVPVTINWVKDGPVWKITYFNRNLRPW